MNKWREVSSRNPCPVCQSKHWCEIHVEGNVHCMKVPSERPMTRRMGGWIHGTLPHIPPPRTLRTPTRALFDAGAWWQAKRSATRFTGILGWAVSLRLRASSIDWLGACVDGDILAFPMHDGYGKICGIRTRYKNGDKMSIKGSRSGLFLPTVHDDTLEPLIVEGPTDAAAAMMLGFEPIGRPQCLGTEEAIVRTCKRFGYKRVTICADNDSHGAGMRGALSLSRMLKVSGISTRVVLACGHKDLREAVSNGVTRQEATDSWSVAEWS